MEAMSWQQQYGGNPMMDRLANAIRTRVDLETLQQPLGEAIREKVSETIRNGSCRLRSARRSRGNRSAATGSTLTASPRTSRSACGYDPRRVAETVRERTAEVLREKLPEAFGAAYQDGMQPGMFGMQGQGMPGMPGMTGMRRTSRVDRRQAGAAPGGGAA